MVSQDTIQCETSKMLSLHQLTDTIYLLSDTIIDVENIKLNEKTLPDHLPTKRL